MSNHSKIPLEKNIYSLEKPNMMMEKDAEKMTNTKRTIKFMTKVFISSAQESTTHGIPHFFRRRNLVIRSLWALSFTASAIFCSFLIFQSVSGYFDYNTVTRVQRIYMSSSEFPTVTVCSLNPYMTNVSYHYVQSVLENNNLSVDDAFESTLKSLKFVVGLYANNLSDSQRRSFGYELNDMLLSCTYNLNRCTADDFDWFYDVFYGNCYKFNSGKFENGSNASVAISSMAGVLYGLNIELFLYESNNPMSLASSTGARVVVHNKSTTPLFLEGIPIAAGSQTNLQVDRVFSSYLEKPYSECERNLDARHPSKLVRALVGTRGQVYSQKTCFLACFQLYSIEKCGCYQAYLQVLTGTPSSDEKSSSRPCTNLTDIYCYGIVYDNANSLNANVKCGDLCPRECDTIDYDVNAYFADYPSKTYADQLVKNPVIRSKYSNNISQLTYESLKRNLAQFTVYYGELGYQEYDEVESMSWLDIISSIGGTLGLFLGMSFLSFVELLDVVLQILLHHIKTNS